MAAHAALPGAASFETAGKSRPPQDEGVSTYHVVGGVAGGRFWRIELEFHE
jgi:hypothetical protein